MTHHASLFAGLLVGFSIAVPIGPMGLLCIQRVLVSGVWAGVSTGLGAATVNVLYGALIILGLDKIASSMASGGRVLSFAGGMFLLCSAARMALRQRIPAAQPQPAVLSPCAAYVSAVAFNVTNPLAPMLIVGLLSPIIGQSAPSLGEAVALLFGMFAAASTWWICLSGGIALLRSRLSPGILVIVNQASGVILTVYGIAALARSAGM
jgi:threonine/homoserine/homoserine lactone efflux protein